MHGCACECLCVHVHVLVNVRASMRAHVHMSLLVCPYVWMHASNSVGTWVYERNGDLCSVPARPSSWTRPAAGHSAGRALRYSCHLRPNHIGMQSRAFTLPNFMACWSLLLVFTRGRRRVSPARGRLPLSRTCQSRLQFERGQLSALTELNATSLCSVLWTPPVNSTRIFRNVFL